MDDVRGRDGEAAGTEGRGKVITADDYVNAVLDEMPHAALKREQIAAELRAHVAERVADGHQLDDVLRQLGDPIALAESYLSAEPLVAAPLEDRMVAKLIDAAVVMAFVVPVAALLALVVPLEAIPFIVLVLVILAVSVFLWIYTVIAESQTGQTVGKRARGIHVVRESGRRASLGQAFVRQLPILLNIYWIDAMFALFTEKRQRAFEVLSKTRVVRSPGTHS
jgi:uncharacterized RDD family membrane protein YckC